MHKNNWTYIIINNDTIFFYIATITHLRTAFVFGTPMFKNCKS